MLPTQHLVSNEKKFIAVRRALLLSFFEKGISLLSYKYILAAVSHYDEQKAPSSYFA